MTEQCSLLRELSQETWNRIQFSRSRYGLKVYEVTITQNLIYEINRNSITSNISIFEAIDEKTNGNDIELFVQTTNGFLFFPIQSKIIYKSQNYPKMEHGNQIHDLMNYASSNGGVPFYLLYNFSPGFSFKNNINSISCSASDFGCSLIEANYLLRNYAFQRTDRNGNSRWIIPTFTELHPYHAIPWFIPFCLGQNEPDKKKIFKEVFQTISDEALSTMKIYSSSEIEEDREWVPIDTTKEKYEDKIREDYQGETKFSPKFRLVFRNEE